MGRELRCVLALVIAVFVVTGVAGGAAACTAVYAGSDVTADGSVLIARNEDYGSANWPKHMVVRPREEHKAGAMQEFVTGLAVPWPSVGYRYTAVPDWDPSWGPFEEAGVNEKGVAVSATLSAESNEAVQAADPFIENAGIEEAVIPSLILPRADTAREGVELLGTFVEKYGAMAGNGLAIADKQEIWQMEIGSGHQWVAVRVPDDRCVVAANAFRLKHVDLTDSDNVMASGKVFSLAKEEGFLAEGSTRDDFDFAGTYGVMGDPYNTYRIWLGQKLLTPSVQQNPESERFPLYMTPDEPIKPRDVMDVLRADYSGTVLEGKAERPIGYHGTLESHIIQLRPDLPELISPLIWQCFGTAPYSVYLPFYGSITETPELFRRGNDQYSPNSAWWIFRSVAALAKTDEQRLGSQLQELWRSYEEGLLSRQPYVDEMIASMLADGKGRQAQQLVDDYSSNTAIAAVEQARAYGRQLVTLLTKAGEKDYDPKLCR
ncbi:MAG: C69 family dipeptidase [Synergistales bacterium]|nr:C69 family dipeptidase [Synergistales bacterium]